MSSTQNTSPDSASNVICPSGAILSVTEMRLFKALHG